MKHWKVRTEAIFFQGKLSRRELLTCPWCDQRTPGQKIKQGREARTQRKVFVTEELKLSLESAVSKCQ